jgi:heme exporter protein D
MHNFSTFSQFWSMGGYAFYVWSAYGIGLSTLLLNIFISRKHRRKTIKILQERLRSIDYDTPQKKA